MRSASMATFAVNPIERKPGPYPRGRKCCVKGCKTILSQYNGTNRCAVHLGWDDIELNPETFAQLYKATLYQRDQFAEELARMMEGE